MKGPSIALQSCALLFGTPVSREEFDRACRRVPRSDYIAHVVGDNPEEAWHRNYATVAETAQELITTARNLGAVICREATLSDFSYVTAHAKVVILLAHFRGFDFSEEDFLSPVNSVVAAIEARSHPVLAYFDPVPRDLSLLVDAFNVAVMGRKLLSYLPSALDIAGRNSISVGRVLCRDLLDEALAGITKPGNQVDLFDGLHSLGAMEAALWRGFRGELDLALCNSAALATYIDLHRNNTVRHLHWPDLIDPIPQFALIGETLRRLSGRGGSYINTRLIVEEEMLHLNWSSNDNRRHP
jgi:hypothetical protein